MADLARLVIQIRLDGARQANTQLKRLATSANRLSRSALDMRSALARGQTGLDQFAQEARSAGNMLSTFSNMQRRTATTATSFSSSLKTVGRDFIRNFTVPITAAATASARFSLELNRGLGATQSLLAGTFEQNQRRILEFRDAVTQTSIDTGRSFTDLTDGLYESISAFQDGEDAIDRFNNSVRAAVAGQAETRDAVRLLAAVTRAYGDTSSEATQRVSDYAFQTIRLGVTTLPQLSSAIQLATDRTSRLGISQAELFAVGATLTGITGEASQVYTQLRSALDSLLAPSDALQELFQRLGVSSGEALIQERGLIGAFVEIERAARNSGRPLQDYIQRKEGITAVSQLATEQFQRYVNSLNEIIDSTGATNRAFDAQTMGIDNVGFQLNQVRQRFQVLGDQLARVFLPVLNDVLEGLSDITEFIVDRIGPGFVTFTGTITALVGPATVLAGAFNRLVTFLGNIGVEGGAAAGILGTLGIVLGAIATVVGLIGFTARETERQYLMLDDTQQRGIDTLDALGTVVAALGSESGDAQDAFRDLVREFPELSEQIMGVEMAGEAATEQIYEIAGAILDLQAAADVAMLQTTVDDLLPSEREVISAMRSQQRLMRELGIGDDEDEGGLLGGTLRRGTAQAPVVDPLTTNPALRRVEAESMVGAELQRNSNLLEQYRADQQQVEDQVDRLNEKYSNTLFHFELIGREIVRVRNEVAGLDGDGDEVTDRLLDWREVFEAITNIPISDFGTVVDREVGEFTGSGIEAANAYISTLDEAREAGREFAENTMQEFDELSIVEDQIETLEGIIMGLIGFDEDRIMPGEAFDYDDESIQRLIGYLNELRVLQGELGGDDYFPELNRDLQAINSQFRGGLISELEREQAVFDRLQEELQMLAAEGMEGTAQFDAIARAIARADNNITRLQESMANLTFEGQSEILTGFLNLFRSAQEGEKSVGSLGDRIEAFAEMFAVQIGTVALGQLDKFGEALGSLEDDSLEDYFRDLVRQILEAVPYLLFQAGLYFIPINLPVAISLLALSGIAAFGIGFLRGRVESEDDDSELRNEFARGGVFDNGLQRFQTGAAFSRGIFNTPTRFRFQGGTGVLGESGPEGILPLQRTASGDLGVTAVGAGNGPLVNIEIINQTNAQIQQEETTDPDGRRNVRLLITSTVNSSLANGTFDRTMAGRFGLRPAGN